MKDALDAIYLKVGGDTSPVSLKTAMVANLQQHDLVVIDAIGMAANYVLLKALIRANSELAIHGLTLFIYPPYYKEVELSNGNKTTAIRHAFKVESKPPW